MSAQAYFLLPHPGEPRFLLVRSAGRGALPFLASEETETVSDAYVTHAFEKKYGAAVLILMQRRFDTQEGSETALLTILENRERNWRPPPDAAWFGSEDLAGLDLAAPAIRSVLEDWLAESEGRKPADHRRAPWSSAGWFDAARQWVEDQLQDRGLEVSGPVEQFRTWCISAVLRAAANDGAVYFKAVPDLFGAEPAITRFLAERYPERLPGVLATDSDRHWMLMKEVPGDLLRESDDVAVWEQAMRSLAELQLDSVSVIVDLLQLGCANRRLPSLEMGLTDLLKDLESVELLDLYAMKASDVSSLRRRADPLKDRVRELAACGMPETLIHGDFHSGNIMVHGSETVFIDWTDAAIAHPFFDLQTILGDHGGVTLAGEDVTDRLEAAYLGVWSRIYPPAQIRRAAALARQIAPLYHALSYRAILHALEPAVRFQFACAIRHYLGLLLSEG